jgi:4-hydroxy-3-polyprenylbenzoate decarboxylase
VETGTSKSKTAKAYIDATSDGEGSERADGHGVAERRDQARSVLARAGIDLDPGGPDG